VYASMRKPTPMVPLLYGLVVFLTPAACLFMLLYWLMQPTVRPNLGMAAYQPPSGTRVEPLPPKIENVQLPDLLAHNFSAFAAAEPEKPQVAAPVAPVKREARGPARERPKPRPQQREYHDPSNNFAWGNNNRQRQQRGNSWFW
jgi:hypothetical protein